MSADWWQNFANNFAGDLAPLISLFGESPTKQYLSETLTFIDIFIFSMAPIGVITALVSAIRVAGGPSLRAFIGRAQEGAGMAEAELCSSTSRNVCELYTNGGIARVFGRPKILEFVHDWESDPTPNQQKRKSHSKTDPTTNQQERKSNDKPDTTSNQQKPNSYDKAGIYSFREFLSCEHWEEQGRSSKSDVENTSKPIYRPEDFAPHPNLSLNVGIKKLHWAWFYLAAVLGFVLQAGVLAFAALITYKYPKEFQRDDSQIAVPAFPFVCAGTILLCFGIGMCAFIIESSTYERTFKRKEDKSSRLYWIQPGDQVVGDQVFDYFAYSDAKSQLKEYTTSVREIDRINHTKPFLTKQSIRVWVATSTTTVGFALQFLGLRALHSTVSVAQLGAMVIMSIARALLRTRRLEEYYNLLGRSNTLYLHHELDWLALELAQEDQSYSAQGVSDKDSKPLWLVVGPSESEASSNDKTTKAYIKRVKLAQMTGAQTMDPNLTVDNPWEEAMVSSRTWASKLACAIEGVMGVINRRCTPNKTLRTTQVPWSLRCCMSTAPGYLHKNSTNSTIQFTISHDTEGTGSYGPWKADRAQLESVLGLWLWSITSRQRNRNYEKKDSGSINEVQRASRLIYVLGDSSSPVSEASLRLWLGNHSSSLERIQLNPVYPAFHPSSVWLGNGNKEEDDQLDQVREHDFQRKQHPAAQRIFGSNVIPRDHKSGPLKVLHLPSAGCLEMMCAQELFAIFFSAVTPKIEEIRGNTEIVEGPRKFYVTNSTLSEMVENFISSGLGNYDDAIACMVPVLHSARKLSYSTPFLAARAAGEEYCEKKKWEKAEHVLLPALKAAVQAFGSAQSTPLSGEIPVCLLHLCELYRCALSGDKRTVLFGLRGFNSLFKIFRHREIPEDLRLYRSVALKVLEEGNDDPNTRCAKDELRNWVAEPCAEIVEDFHVALGGADLKSTFYALKPSILSSCTGRPVLAQAAQHGWYSVMKNLQRLGIDTREVDHKGRNYLHYAARMCNAPMFKDLVGDDTDLLQHVDSLGQTPLHLAAAAGRIDVVILLLLTKGFPVDANIRDRFFRSPLDRAILSDQPDTFTFLSTLEKEESPPGDSWDLEIKRLFQAACCCSTKVVLRLLRSSNSIEKLGLDKDELVKRLETNECNNSQVFIDILKDLEEKNYHADEWQIEKRTAISFAAEAGKIDLVIHLKSRAKNSITSRDRSGRTFLHYAVISQSDSVVDALMSDHAQDFRIDKDEAGLSPLDYAIKDGSLTIASMILRENRRGENPLPGTALAAVGERLYFQGSDSRIRTARWNKDRRVLVDCDIIKVSARLFTPLALIGNGEKHCLLYVSEEDILRTWSYNGGPLKDEQLQQKHIKVGKKSRIAVCFRDLGSKAYLIYQDTRDWIRAIVVSDGLPSVYRPAIGAGAHGSGITARAKEHSLCVYFQNKYYEVEKSVTHFKKVGFLKEHTTTLSRLPIRKQDLLLRSPLVCFPSLSDHVQTILFCCDCKGRIRGFADDHTTVLSDKIETTEGSPTRLTVTTDHELFYQAGSGDIHRVYIGKWHLADKAVVAQTWAPEEADCDGGPSRSMPSVVP